jgi:nitrate reductase NapE component
MDSTILVLPIVLLLTPLFLKLASRQDALTKNALRFMLLAFVILPLVLGFLNWETFTSKESFLTGYQTAKLFPLSLLGVFFLLCAALALILATNKERLFSYVSVGTFTATLIVFYALIYVSRDLAQPFASLASIGTVFSILFANIIGLLLINRKDLTASYVFWPSPKSKARHPSKKNIYKSVALALVALSFGMIVWIFIRSYPLFANVSASQAVAHVRALPEVEQFMKTVGNPHVEVDHYDKEQGVWLVQVFEIVDEHQATFNWYTVNPHTGVVKSEF